jgi:CBS domain-containing protein
MRVRDVLRSKTAAVVSVPAGAGLQMAARLMVNHGIGGLPVVNGRGEVVGFLAERDIVRALDFMMDGAGRAPVDSVMKRPAPTCGADDPLYDVMKRMTRDRLRHLVVMEDGRPIGVISVGDLVKHRLEQLELETGVLRDYVAAQRATSG